jgi:NADPH-dependent F420 reductase
MKISIIGTGNVGKTLGQRWAEKGHEIIFGSRDPGSNKAMELVKKIDKNCKVSGIAEAVEESAIIVLSVPWSAIKDTIKAMGNLDGKILIDCTNPIAADFSNLSIGTTTSAGEQIANWAKGAKVVKAFNSTGSDNMANPIYDDQKITMLVCGDNPDAKKQVMALAEEIDFEAQDAGDIIAARFLEPLAMLWVHLGYKVGLGPNFAFKIIKR